MIPAEDQQCPAFSLLFTVTKEQRFPNRRQRIGPTFSLLTHDRDAALRRYVFSVLARRAHGN